MFILYRKIAAQPEFSKEGEQMLRFRLNESFELEIAVKSLFRVRCIHWDLLKQIPFSRLS